MKGALHGLFRVREFTQDDAHLFIRPDQITEQVTDASHLITAYYAQFGFPYRVELSTRPEDSMGSDEDWERAEQACAMHLSLWVLSTLSTKATVRSTVLRLTSR